MKNKINVLKIIIIIACVIGIIGIFLPYEASTKEYKDYLQKNPTTMNVEEINLTNKGAVNISILENFKLYLYGISNGNSSMAGVSMINLILTIVLIVSIILILVFTIFNKRILNIIFGILLLGSSLLMNFDITDRGVIPSSRYTYGFAYYLYPIIAIVIIISIIILMVKNKKDKLR